MRAIVMREAGGPEVLTLRDVPSPPVYPGHVKIAVTYAGVNRADLLQRQGRYAAPPFVSPDILGLEYTGTVIEVSETVTRHKVGDRVFGLLGGGGYAEHVVVHEREAVAVPAILSDELAGAVPETFVTAYDALVVRGKLAPGETVLIHAVGSGVGTAAVSIARALGCSTIGTSRSADKLTLAAPLGLGHGLVPQRETDPASADLIKFADEARSHTGGRGVDVVLDLVGGDYTRESLAAVALGGRIVVVGLTGGRTASLDLGLLLHRRATIVGTVLRSRPLEEKILAAQLLAGPLTSLLERGSIAPVVDRVFSLEDAAEAHRYLGENGSFGKVLLRVAPQTEGAA
jgi:NADPH:quinone reductase